MTMHWSHCIVRVYLYRQVLLSINKFHKQRKFIAMSLIVATAEQTLLIASYQLQYRQSGIYAIGHNRHTARQRWNLPAFADWLTLVVHPLELRNLASTPECMLKYRCEFPHNLLRCQAFCSAIKCKIKTKLWINRNLIAWFNPTPLFFSKKHWNNMTLSPQTLTSWLINNKHYKW